jgi:hypothetical protein
MTLWTAYPTAPVAVREGTVVDAAQGSIISRVAEAILRAGCGAVRGTTWPPQVNHPTALAAADPDALVTAAVAISNVAGLDIAAIAQFDGVGLGGAMTRIVPARTITITYDAAVDWNTVDGQRVDEIFGLDANGDPIHEQLVRANGAGAVTLTTQQCFSGVPRIQMQASLGGAGTATIGIGTKVEYGKLDFEGVVCYDRTIPPPATANYDIDATLPCSLLQGPGEIGAIPEDAVTVGEPVYMRVVAGGGAAIRGRFTGQLQADDANWARVLGLMWSSAAAGGSPARIRVL